MICIVPAMEVATSWGGALVAFKQPTGFHRQRSQHKRSRQVTGIIVRASSGESPQVQQIRVCTNRSCRQLGSLQTLDVVRNLAPAGVEVESCGCLGKCGSGPNLVILPDQFVVMHCNTAAHAARLLELRCGAGDATTNLDALRLKERGNELFQSGKHEPAIEAYSQAIGLNPSGGLHFLYSNRAAVRLATGDLDGAMQDVERALAIAPSWPAGYLRKADVYIRMGHFQNAQSACTAALELDPSLRRSKSYQAKIGQISQNLGLVSATV